MGQNSSKRRSYTPGVDKTTEIATSPRANSDVKYDTKANGSIEVHGDHDVSAGEPTTPTSPRSVTSSSSSTGKKEKKKRFRVGFSLRRTPSGRWTRKKRTATQNGTRPMSCPVPIKEEEEDKGFGRPQSLFLDELEIHEDDTKHEIVDLSDNEDGKTKSKSGDKSAPKPKGKRGSKKNSSGKKKKKEKPSSKKDKKKKQKEAEAAAVAATGKAEVAPAAPVEAAVVATEVSQTETSISSSKVEAEISNGASEITPVSTNEADLEAVASSIVAETVSIAQERLKAESLQASEIALSTTEVKLETPTVEITTPEVTNPDPEITPAEVLVTPKDSEQTEVKVEETLMATSVGTESAAIVAEEIISQVIDKPPEAPPREKRDKHVETQQEQIEIPTVSASVEKTDEPLVAEVQESLFDATDSSISAAAAEAVAVAEQAEAEVNQLVASSASVQLSSDPNDDVMDQAPNVCVESEAAMDKKPSSPVHVHPAVSVPEVKERSVELNSEISTDVANVQSIGGTGVHYEEIFANDTKEEESENVAKETMEELVSAAVEIAEGEKDTKDYEVVKVKSVPEDANAVAEKSGSDSENDKAKKAEQEKQKRETERLEREQLKKHKEEEKAKERERMKEEKRKKAEQKALEKAEKEKSKAEKKIKVPKRLSSLFHRKDKQAKNVAEVEIDASENDVASPSETSPPDSPLSPSQGQEVETMVCPVEQAPIETQPPTSPPPANASLTVNISLEPLEASKAEVQKSSPESEDTASHPCLESPNNGTSGTSDSCEPVSPTSDGEKGGGTSGSLKKISLGPRLRTAILRKRSSGASDSGHDDKRLSLTQPKAVESADITPPPRKLRPRKPVEQYSPITPGAHNMASPPDASPQPEDSALDSSVQSETTEIKTIIEDSGVADLTSPEGDISDRSCTKENEPKTIIEETVEAAQSVTVSCTPTGQTSSGVKAELQDKSETVGEIASSLDTGDDSAPPPSMHLDLDKPNISLPGAEVSENDDKDNITISPLASPTLVSTATIVLRSPSVEETQSEMNSVNNNEELSAAAEELVTSCNSQESEVNENKDNVKTEVSVETEVSANMECSNIVQTSSSPLVSSSPYQQDSIESASETCTQNANLSNDDDDACQQQQQQYSVVCAAQTSIGQKVKSAGEVLQPSSDVALPENIDVVEQDNHSKARTVAEYQIGIPPKSEEGERLQTKTLNEFLIGVHCDESQKTIDAEAKQEQPDISRSPSNSTDDRNGGEQVDDSSPDKTLTSEDSAVEDNASGSKEEISADDSHDQTLTTESETSQPPETGTTNDVEKSSSNMVSCENGVMTDEESHGKEAEEERIIEKVEVVVDKESVVDKGNSVTDDDDDVDDTKPLNTEKPAVEDTQADKTNGPSQKHNGEVDSVPGNDNNNDICDANKSGPTDTIEAYLKLQYADSGLTVNGNEQTVSTAVVNGTKDEINNLVPPVAADAIGQIQEEAMG